MQVVGTFIDAEKLLQNNVEIKAGIRSETKNLSTRISQYSQGVIESLEVLSVDQDEGLYRVEAKVAVRIEDFKYYIRESVLAERKVQQGLLAQIKVKEDQEQGAAELLGKIFRDAKSYSVVVPRVGEIEAVEDPSLVQELERALPGRGYLIRIPVTARLSDDFLANALRVFDETAEQRYRGPALNNADPSPLRPGGFSFLVYAGDFFYGGGMRGCESNNGGVRLGAVGLGNYDFPGLPPPGHEFCVNSPQEFTAYSYPSRSVASVCKRLSSDLGRGNDDYGVRFIPIVELKFIAADRSVKRDETLSLVPHVAATILSSGLSLVREREIPTAIRFLWSEGTRQCLAALDTQLTFSIYSRVSEDLLRETEKIQVRLISSGG